MTNSTFETSNKVNGAVPDFKSKHSSGDHQLEQYAQKAGEQVGVMANGIATSAADSLRVSRQYVQENPAKGVAIAAGIGLVAGSLLTIMISRSRK